MIITDKFVMLNYPKTGSTFTRTILKEIHHTYDSWPSKTMKRFGLIAKPAMAELMLDVGNGKTRSQHGAYRQIPVEHRHKKIASVVRNPVDRYISEYLYGWWKEHPENFSSEIEMRFHQFPHLSFQEYFEMISMSARAESRQDIGYETVRFIKFFYEDPETILTKIDDNYVTSNECREDLPDITFLHQENLNEELFTFLLALGYPDKDISLVRNAAKVNVTQRDPGRSAVEDFFTTDLLADVLRKDRLLFTLFPEYAGRRL